MSDIARFHRCLSHRPARQQGFTLIEMLTVIALIAIAAAWAVPNMATLIRSSRATGEINQLGAAIRYAKSEAIKRGGNVIMCPTTDNASCSNSTSWHTGWIIFSDTNANGQLDAGEALKVEQSFSKQDTLETQDNATLLQFNRDGFAFGLPESGAVTFTLKTTPEDSHAQRCLQVNLSGNYTLLKKGAPGCA